MVEMADSNQKLHNKSYNRLLSPDFNGETRNIVLFGAIQSFSLKIFQTFLSQNSEYVQEDLCRTSVRFRRNDTLHKMKHERPTTLHGVFSVSYKWR